jgi:hypothetical protein
VNKDYTQFLKEKIFKTKEFAQFDLLFDSLDDFFRDNKEKSVLLLERSHIYNGKSIFAGLVPRDREVRVIDFRMQNADTRSGYQASWLNDGEFEFKTSQDVIVDTGTSFNFSSDNYPEEILLIPNVLHHCGDFELLLKTFLKKAPHLKKIYIFDSYIRENHQNPDDFSRYTLQGLERVLAKFGFDSFDKRETGNVFDVLRYFISQAEKVLQFDENRELGELLRNHVVPLLDEKKLDPKYRSLGRPYASLASAYSVIFKRA